MHLEVKHKILSHKKDKLNAKKEERIVKNRRIGDRFFKSDLQQKEQPDHLFIQIVESKTDSLDF
jgi:hypothetical protein